MSVLMAWTATLSRHPQLPAVLGPLLGAGLGPNGDSREPRVRRGFLMSRGWGPVGGCGCEEGTGAGVGRTGSRWLFSPRSVCSPFPPCFGGSPRGSAQLPGVLKERRNGVGETIWGWNSLPEAAKPRGLGNRGTGLSPALPLAGHVTSATSRTPPHGTAVRTREAIK